MTDHSDPFAIGQQVLFASRTDPLDGWRTGTIATVGAIDRMRAYVNEGDYSRWREERENHTREECRFVYAVETDSTREPTTGVCKCNYHLADADASGRWRDGAMITTREDYQLLWTDTRGRLQTDSSGATLEETDIVTLSHGGMSAEIDVHDLLKWAALPGGEG